jgi:hypothetical protein
MPTLLLLKWPLYHVGLLALIPFLSTPRYLCKIVLPLHRRSQDLQRGVVFAEGGRFVKNSRFSVNSQKNWWAEFHGQFQRFFPKGGGSHPPTPLPTLWGDISVLTSASGWKLVRLTGTGIFGQVALKFHFLESWMPKVYSHVTLIIISLIFC